MYEEVYALSNFKQENVDTILLRKESIVLDEIRIIGAQPQIIRKRDTTIVNTSTFKTSMDSYLNEFLSRIPGMVYNKQTGVVTYNGRQIQAIRLNGKPFFDGDMQTALQRLPTLYIDKIKIYQVHGNDDSDNRSDGLFVLDLKTKAEFNGAYLNSIGGGYGSNDKQYIKTETNYFEEDGTNLSFFAERSNKDLYNKYDGNIAYNVGVSSHQQINEQLTIAGSITYNHIKNGSYSEKYEEQYFSPNNFYSSTNNVNFNKNNQLMYRTFIDWKPNENTAFFIDLGYDYSKNHSSNKNQTLTLNKYSKSLKCDWEEIPDSVRINENDFNKLFSRIEKYENISDNMEVEIANYLNQVSEGRLSSESKLQIREMLREVTEIESIGDSCYNLARTINRKRRGNIDFTEKQYEHIHQMFALTDNALTQMIKLVEDVHHIVDVNKSFNLENEINNYRNQLKNQNIVDVNNKEYSYQMGIHYMDIIGECEKLGDYVVNVVEAHSDVKEKKA